MRCLPKWLIFAVITLSAIPLFAPPVRAQSLVSSAQRSAAWSAYGYDPAPDFIAYDPQYRDKISRYKDQLESLRQ